MNTYDINKIKLPNGDICNLRDQHVIITKTVQNTNIIHIEDAAEKPLKECKIDIQPVQDLHGYNHPWVGGAGKNLINMPDYSLNKDTNRTKSITLSQTIPAGNYIFSCNKAGTARRVAFTFRDSSDVKIGEISIYPSSGGHLQGNMAITADAVAIYTFIDQSDADGVTAEITNVMLTSADEEDQTYAPYENICPITGFDNVSLTRQGKNLLCYEGWKWHTNGSFAAQTTAKASQLLAVKPGDVLTASKAITFSSTSANCVIRQFNKNKEFVSSRSFMLYDVLNSTYTVPEGIYYIGITQFYEVGQDTSEQKAPYQAQVEFGSTATSYEPYSGTTYSITFPTEAGTVYGGSLDVTNGVLTVNRAIATEYTFTGNVSSGSNMGHYVSQDGTGAKYLGNDGSSVICNMLPIENSYGWNAPYPSAQAGGVAGRIRVYGSFSTLAEFREQFAGLQICYPLANPITYQLTPKEITTLLGTNNIWADTGNISCTYYVDSQLNTELNNYISKLHGTAKGDMIYYSDNTTPSRLEIGNQGQALKVNSDGVPYWNNENVAQYKTLTDQEIATFDDGVQNSVLKSYSVKIEPKQDLHGYDKPWIGGAGKNLLPQYRNNTTINDTNFSWDDEGILTISNKNTAAIRYDLVAGDGLITLDAGNYILSGGMVGNPESNNIRIQLRKIQTTSANDNVIAQCYPNQTNVEFTLSEATSFYPVLFISVNATDEAFPMTWKPMITLASETDQTYEPYENICPITGYDALSVTDTGANMINLNTSLAERYGVYYVVDKNEGSVRLSGTASQDANRNLTPASSGSGNAIRVTPGEQYFFSGTQSGGSTQSSCLRIVFRDADGVAIKINKLAQLDIPNEGIIYTAPSNAVFVDTYAHTAANVKADGVVLYPFMCHINDDHTFQPYTSNSVSINLVSSAGSTVYGGTVTVNEDGSGTLVVDKVSQIFSGNENWYKTDTTSYNRYFTPPISGMYNSESRTRIISNYGYFTTGNNIQNIFISTGRIYYYASLDITDVAAFKEFLAQHPLQVCYPLAMPQIFNLTTAQLKILLGTNHIWSDAGNITLTYPVNLKGYIDSINNLTDNYVKYTDYATNDTCGVVKTNGAFGILTDNTGLLKLVQPTNTEIQTATGMYKVITPYSQHKAAFYGLAKAAGDTTQASSTNTVGNYTQEAKTSIQDMLGISDIIAPVQETTIASKIHLPNEKFYYKGKIYKVTSPIFANDLITPGVNCEQITLAEAMPVSIIEGQGGNSLVLNDLIKTNATGVKSVAEGTSKAKAGYSHAEGQESEASGAASHAEGWYSKAKGSHSHAEGGLDNTRGKIKITGAANATTYTYTVVDNDFTENFGNHALYYNNVIYDISAIDIVGKTVTVTKTLSASTALSNVQVSWGTYSYAQGINAHAENSAYAYSQGSHAEGVSVAADLYSHAEGKSYTIGEYSHAENNSIAAGNYSHAEGYGSTLGAYAHAQGYNTSAEGANSHAEGQNTTASRKNQHVFGKYNIADEPANTTSDDLGTYVEIVGNGTSTSATSNARTLDWNGNEVLAGSLTIGGNEVLNKATLQQLKGMPVNIVDGNGTTSIVLGNTSKTKATGTRAIAEATGTASGTNSHAEGWSTEARATAAHSEGYFSRAVGSYSHAEGGYYTTFDEMRVTGAANATTYTYNGTYAELEDGPNYLIVYNNTIYTVSSIDVTNKTITLTSSLNKSAAVSNLSVELATTPYAYGSRSHAEGSAYASGQLSHAQGNGARAAGFGSHAEGKLTKASGLYSHAEGFQTLATEQDAHAEGYMTVAAGMHSHVEGSQSATAEYGAHAQGYGTYASGRNSHAEGNQTMATGAAAHSEGYSTEAAGEYAHSEGNLTDATGQGAHAEGLRSIAKGANSHAEGGVNNNLGTIHITGAANATTFTYSDGHTTSKFYENYPNSYILYQSLWFKITNIDTTRKQITLQTPLSSSAINDLEVSWGTYSYANQECSHAEGSSCAYDEYAHAEGVGTVAAGWTSHSEGYRTLASGDWSHAQGQETIASYHSAHAEGQYTEASNYGSHAEGDSTKASGNYSHAEGTCTIASADYAHAEGAETQASGKSSHSEGNSTVANHASQHVFGEYNIVDTSSATADSRGTYVEIVGKGTSDSLRSNARTLDWSGNEWLAGNLTLGDHTLMPKAVPSVIFGTQTETTAAWTGKAPFSTLTDGTMILYWLPQTSASNATLNLTLANGLTTGAKNVYINGTTRCGTHIARGNLVLMIYRFKPTIGSITTYQGWWIVKAQDTTTNYYDRVNYKMSVTATAPIAAGHIGVFNSSGKLIELSTTAFDITKPILYIGSAYTADKLTNTGNYIAWGSPFALSNTISGFSGPAGKTVYIKGTLDGVLFTPASGVVTTTIPTSDDGYTYLVLGHLSTTTNICLPSQHPMFKYKNGGFKSMMQILSEL